MTYVNDSADADNYSRAQVVNLIEDVDVVDVITSMALLIGALCQTLVEVGEYESTEAYLQNLGTSAHELAHHEG